MDIDVKGLSKMKESSKVWASASRWLTPPNAACDYWWQLTGPHLAALVESAGYSVEKQFEALLFYYNWIIPYLGPAPSPNGTVQWKCVPLGGAPIEYSWKWNIAGGEPDIRYCFEGINELTGGDYDPLNQQATRLLLHRLRSVDPSIGLGLADHFFATLFDHDNSKYAEEVASVTGPRTTILMAAELDRSGYKFKTYFMPRKLGRVDTTIPLQAWDESFRTIDPNNEARAMLWDFLCNDPEGKLLTPYMVGIDNSKDPSQSRMKFYFQTPSTSFSSVRQIMTLGGRLKVQDTRLEDFRELILSVLSLPADFPEAADLPHPNRKPRNDDFAGFTILLQGSTCYFDIATGAKAPEVKYYVHVRGYARDDLSIAHGVTSWMQSKGRGAFCQRYISLLDQICQHRSLEKRTGIQTYLSCMLKQSGETDIASYLSPEAFHPDRLGRTDGRS
ncbi:dimethylallyl tryptophan synthase GliD1 [Xylaria scruposa]|nr:dimethylallyl tryptophan synthase GliD1 [Xylaria scruposa]